MIPGGSNGRQPPVPPPLPMKFGGVSPSSRSPSHTLQQRDDAGVGNSPEAALSVIQQAPVKNLSDIPHPRHYLAQSEASQRSSLCFVAAVFFILRYLIYIYISPQMSLHSLLECMMWAQSNLHLFFCIHHGANSTWPVSIGLLNVLFTRSMSPHVI